MCKSILKGQNVPGTDGTYHGTDGTRPRDRRDAHQGVSRQNSLCLLVFFFPHFRSFFLYFRGANPGRKKQHKHKIFSPDFPRTFLTLTPECLGVKKFLPTTGAAGKCTFWCGRPRFSARTSMTRRVVEKLCTKNSLR